MLTLTLAGCESAPQIVNYRLTLTVDTPEGQKTGSSVLEVHVGFHDGFLRMGNAISVGVRGEATIVDLGERGLLFCLLSKDPERKDSTDADHTPSRTWLPQDRASDLPAFYRGLNRNRPVADIPFERLPMLVRFRDLADPMTVEPVDPSNLAAGFGSGVRLERATIEVVSSGWWPFNSIGWPKSLAGERPTEGIINVIPWVVDLHGSISKDRRLPYTHLLVQVTNAYFRRGYLK